MPEQWIEDFFNRKSYSKKSFLDEHLGYANQIAIVGLAGSGTSSLKRNLEKHFPDYASVSGGDYHRSLARRGGEAHAEEAIHRQTKLNAENPAAGTDRPCDTYLLQQTEKAGIPTNGLIMEARCAHIVTRGRACPVLLKCPEHIRVGRVWNRLCNEAVTMQKAMPRFADIFDIVRERDTNDQRLAKIYPGSDWPEEDFFVVNTDCCDEQRVLHLVLQHYNNWRHSAGLLPDTDYEPIGVMACA